MLWSWSSFDAVRCASCRQHAVPLVNAPHSPPCACTRLMRSARLKLRAGPEFAHQSLDSSFVPQVSHRGVRVTSLSSAVAPQPSWWVAEPRTHHCSLVGLKRLVQPRKPQLTACTLTDGARRRSQQPGAPRRSTRHIDDVMRRVSWYVYRSNHRLITRLFIALMPSSQPPPASLVQPTCVFYDCPRAPHRRWWLTGERPCSGRGCHGLSAALRAPGARSRDGRMAAVYNAAHADRRRSEMRRFMRPRQRVRSADARYGRLGDWRQRLGPSRAPHSAVLASRRWCARAPSRPEAEQRPSAHASLRLMVAEHVPRGQDRPYTCGCECRGRGGGRQRSPATSSDFGSVGRSMGPIHIGLNPLYREPAF